MTNITINTTQNVNINFLLADTSLRISAFFIDFLIKAIYYLAVFLMLARTDAFNEMDNWSQTSVYIIFYLPIMFYSLLMEFFNEGQTLGKKIMKIKVVKIDGYQAGFMDYLTRWVMRIIDIQVGFGLTGLIAMSASKNNQRLGDMAAGTSVINLRNTVEFNQTIFEDLETAYVPKYPQVTKLTDNDIRIIKNNFLSAQRQNNNLLASQLADKIKSIILVDSVEKNDFEFISRVIKDYNFYTKDIH